LKSASVGSLPANVGVDASNATANSSDFMLVSPYSSTKRRETADSATPVT
jgi:hypothetical protein